MNESTNVEQPGLFEPVAPWQHDASEPVSNGPPGAATLAHRAVAPDTTALTVAMEPPGEGDSTLAASEDIDRWETLAADLEATGRYKGLRRCEERLDEPPAPQLGPGVKRGVYLDVETTGLMASDRIIELALLAFHYDEDGNVLHVTEALDQFEDPERKIPADIVSLTGITNEMVRGKRIDDAEVARLMEGVDLVVAHNAGFDRQFVEARFPFFSEVGWACSVSDVDWISGGLRSRKLENLALAKGYFYRAHRAIYDCHVALGLLRLPIGHEGPPALADLLRRSSTESVRLWAEGSPFEKKDDLKARYYRWSSQAKCWWRDLAVDEHEAELEWLAANVYPRRRPLPYLKITSRTRYSSRLPEVPPTDVERR